MDNSQKQFITTVVVISFLVSALAGFISGGIGARFINQGLPSGTVNNQNSSQAISTQEKSVEKVVEEVSPAVVSIIATKDLPVMEQYYQEYNPFENFFQSPFDFFFQIPQYRQSGTEEKEVGGGSGFIISSDGLILTNKHVVDIEGADYTVLTNEGNKYPAKVLALDPIQDIAILKIDKKGLPIVKLGDSDNLKIGQTVIAIGNALGEFRNTVSVGVVSGLKRSISASVGLGSSAEELEGVIQTDAAINPGNSGGPLLNLFGEVIGIDVAMAQGAQNIGFALPINIAKRDIDQVGTTGKISYPFLGVRYVLVTSGLKQEKNLSVDYGALIIRGQNDQEPAVAPGGPAEKAGLRENDIILEIDGQKIDKDNPLIKLIQKHNIGDIINLKVLRNNEEKNTRVKLEGK